MWILIYIGIIVAVLVLIGLSTFFKEMKRFEKASKSYIEGIDRYFNEFKNK